MKTESVFFDALTLADKETVQSAFIAWAFSDRCNGLSLEAKLKALKEIFDIQQDLSGIKKIEAKTEWQNIDILFALYDSTEIATTPEFVLVIENKVKCSLHDDQLARYQMQLESKSILKNIDISKSLKKQLVTNASNPFYVSKECRYCRYLTLLPCKSDTWDNMSYKDLISAINSALKITSQCERYTRHIDFHIVKSYCDSINKMSEVANIAMERPSLIFGTKNENNKTDTTYYDYIIEYRLRHVLQVYYFEQLKSAVGEITSNYFKRNKINPPIYPKVGYGMQSDSAEIGISINEGILINKYLNFGTKANSDRGFGICFQGGAFKIDVVKDYTDSQNFKKNKKILAERGFLREAKSKGDQTETIFDYYKSECDKRWTVNPPKSRPRMAMSIGIKELYNLKEEWYLQPDPKKVLLGGFEHCSFVLLDLLEKYDIWYAERK